MKHIVPISIFLSLLLFAVLGTVILAMQDGLPLSFGKHVSEGDYNPILNIVKPKADKDDKEKGPVNFVKFNSEEDFKNYLTKSEDAGVGFGDDIYAIEESTAVSTGAVDVGFSGGATSKAERFSETNVQVAGIDEPDIVKTDGENLYISTENRYFHVGGAILESFGEEEKSISMLSHFPQKEFKTSILNALPVDDIESIGEIKETGNLLLSGDDLVIFSGNLIVGYDISAPENSEKTWDLELRGNTQFVQARLLGGKIYLVTKQYVNRSAPCPLEPFSVNGASLSISCGDIYHPQQVVSSDFVYNVGVLDIKTGDIENTVSFIGSYDSTVYMSEDSFYVAYSYNKDYVDFFYGFLLGNEDLFSNEFLLKIKRLQGYELSNFAKQTELNSLLNDFYMSMDSDERLRAQNEIQNRTTSYLELNKREFKKTDIIKIGLEEFKIEASGTVPGRLLNQFSLDQYQNHLRVAVTVGERFFGFGGFGGSAESANDVYILDENMTTVGAAKDMGLDERIYSVRFLADKGYVVTFKQIDPFYVLNLSDPTKPIIEGELKIPGYSSYLHPIDKDSIVGVGKEDGKVKISLFGVADPKNPKELSKYTLDEYWSDVLNTHHAFLLDDKHKVFFMPGGKGGYIFSYAGNKLKLQKAVSGLEVKRAVFINDYLYVIAEDRMVVLDENTWERVNEFKLDKD